MSSDKLTKWLDVLVNIHEKGIASCPYCKGHNIDYGYIDSSGKGEIGYGVVWCNDCHHAFKISSVQLSKRSKIIEKEPSGLIY